MVEFKYAPMFQLGEDRTEYYKIPGSESLVSTSDFEGHKILKVSKEALTIMANTAFRDVSFMLRRTHNEQVAKILSDPEASENDKYEGDYTWYSPRYTYREARSANNASSLRYKS